MNDFTKEELQIIYANSNPCVSDEMRPILDKIQSMIDNYCEHEWAYYFSCDGSDVKCMKCGRKLYDNH